MGTGRQYPASVRSESQTTGGARDAIIRATIDLIRSQGVAGTSISDIVARSKTSAGAIYHHFGSKERLILEVGQSILAKPLEMVLQTNPDLSPAQLFRAALAQLARDETTPELLLQIWAGAKSDATLGRLIQTQALMARDAVRTFMAAWCAKHSPATDPDDLAELIMGLVTGYALLRAMAVNRPPEAYGELGSRLIAQALAAD